MPPGDAVVLANAIITLLEDHSEAQSMGIRGAAAVEQGIWLGQHCQANGECVLMP